VQKSKFQRKSLGHNAIATGKNQPGKEEVEGYTKELEKEGRTDSEEYQAGAQALTIIDNSTKLVRDYEEGLVIDTDYAVLSTFAQRLQKGVHGYNLGSTRLLNKITTLKHLMKLGSLLIGY
jgi:hypothetical protein